MARRADVTERLRRIAASDKAGELIAALDDPSPEVVRCAIRRLTGIEGDRAADALRARLLSADLSLSADIAIALRRIGDECAVERSRGCEIGYTRDGSQPPEHSAVCVTCARSTRYGRRWWTRSPGFAWRCWAR